MIILLDIRFCGCPFLLYVVLHILRDIIKCAKNGIKYCHTIISENNSFHFVKFSTESIIYKCRSFEERNDSAVRLR